MVNLCLLRVSYLWIEAPQRLDWIDPPYYYNYGLLQPLPAKLTLRLLITILIYLCNQPTRPNEYETAGNNFWK